MSPLRRFQAVQARVRSSVHSIIHAIPDAIKRKRTRKVMKRLQEISKELDAHYQYLNSAHIGHRSALADEQNNLWVLGELRYLDECYPQVLELLGHEMMDLMAKLPGNVVPAPLSGELHGKVTRLRDEIQAVERLIRVVEIRTGDFRAVEVVIGLGYVPAP